MIQKNKKKGLTKKAKKNKTTPKKKKNFPKLSIYTVTAFKYVDPDHEAPEVV